MITPPPTTGAHMAFDISPRTGSDGVSAMETIRIGTRDSPLARRRWHVGHRPGGCGRQHRPPTSPSAPSARVERGIHPHRHGAGLRIRPSEELVGMGSPGGFATGGHRDKVGLEWPTARCAATPRRAHPQESRNRCGGYAPTTSFLPGALADPLVPIQETAGTLGRLCGKADPCDRASRIFGRPDGPSFAEPRSTRQSPYNLFERDAERRSSVRVAP